MKTLSPAQIETLHATRTKKGAGFAPDIATCLEAARAGQLYDVDTQSRGADCLTVATSEDDALSEIAMHEEPELATAHPEGAAAWARERGWSADRVSLTAGAGRITDLDPRTVGRDGARRVAALLQRLAFRMAQGVTVDLYAPRYREGQLPAHGAITDTDLDATQIAFTLAGLTIYAQRGCSEARPALDWTDDEMAADALNDAASDLATDALGTEGGLSEVLLGGDELASDPVRLVLTAAWARVLMSRGDAVSASQLGALAGLHTSRVRALRSAGEIPGWVNEGSGRGATPCPASAARTWLASRGVAGV
jgi:hypothetical protein